MYASSSVTEIFTFPTDFGRGPISVWAALACKIVIKFIYNMMAYDHWQLSRDNTLMYFWRKFKYFHDLAFIPDKYVAC